METSETLSREMKKKGNLHLFWPFGGQIEKNRNPFLVYPQGNLSKWGFILSKFHIWMKGWWLCLFPGGFLFRSDTHDCYQPVGDGVSERRVKRWGLLLCEHQWGGGQEHDWGEKSLTVIPTFWRLFFFLFCLIEAFYLSILVYVSKKTRIWTLDYKGPCSHTMTITLRFSLGEFRLSLLLMFIVVCFMGVYNRTVAGAGSSRAKPYTKTAKFQTGRAHRQFPAILECGSVFGAVFSKTSEPTWLLLAASALSKVRAP